MRGEDYNTVLKLASITPTVLKLASITPTNKQLSKSHTVRCQQRDSTPQDSVKGESDDGIEEKRATITPTDKYEYR